MRVAAVSDGSPSSTFARRFPLDHSIRGSAKTRLCSPAHTRCNVGDLTCDGITAISRCGGVVPERSARPVPDSVHQRQSAGMHFCQGAFRRPGLGFLFSAPTDDRLHRERPPPISAIVPPRAASYRHYPGRRNRLIASPPITNAIAISFHAGSDSCSHQLDAAMPNTGTSSAIGVTVAAG